MSAYRAPDVEHDPGRLILAPRPSNGAMIASIVILAIGVVVDFVFLFSPPRGANQWLILFTWGVLFPAFGLLGLFGRKGDRPRIHEHALVLGEGSSARVIPWSAIVELRTQRFLAGRQSQRSALDMHTLRLRDGSSVEARFAFGSVNDTLLEELRTRTRAHLIESARRALEGGQELDFGAVTVDDAGLRHGDTHLAWNKIRSLRYDGAAQNVIVEGPPSTWIEEPLHKVPNAHVLRALVEERAAGPLRPAVSAAQ